MTKSKKKISKFKRQFLPTSRAYTKQYQIAKRTINLASSLDYRELQFEDPFFCPICWMAKDYKEKEYETPLKFKLHAIHAHPELFDKEEERQARLERQRHHRRLKRCNN